MCSICGSVEDGSGLRPIDDLFEMLARTKHRGPDSVGIYVDGQIHRGRNFSAIGKKGLPQYGRICLGHARLEIVGGAAGIQPLTGCDNRLTLVHNGEIYNYRELRPLLQNHEIKTGSDSEVLLHLIEDYYQGELKQAVKKVMPFLDGMYAFAVTDGHALVLARDPIGKKPVYYTPTFPFAFVSEPKALNGQARKLKRLKPGEILEVKDGKIRTTLGYRIERPQIQIDDSEEAIAAYATAIDRSIAKRTHGLDRGAVLFSGGVDSVFVAQLLKHAGLSVTGYCSGLEEATDVQHAMQAAQEMDIPLRIAFLTEDLVDGVLADVIAAIELNGMVQVEAAIPMYLAAKMASEDGHKIMFTGQAADELFAGYPWYGTVVRDEGYLALHHKMWHDIDQLYLDTLEREDRMTMVHSLELRAPYLDREVIRTAMQISPRQKIKGPEDPYRKLVHRELALRRSVPEFIAYRKKARAQDGTKVQSLLQILAEKYFKGRTIPTELELTDYGSNYRYLKEEYGTQELAAYLAEISKPHNIIVPSV